MAEDKTMRGGQDRTHIDVHADDEVREWAKKFDTTPEQVRDAVRAVGNLAADIELRLKGTHATTNADQEARGDAAGP